MLNLRFRNAFVAALVCLWLPFLSWPQQTCATEASVVDGKGEAIQLNVTTHLGDRQTFHEGDVISFFLSLSTEAHIVVVYEDAQHHRIQIIPNVNQPDDFYEAGQFIPIPPQNASYRFRVTAPFGKETLWVFAGDRPIAELEGEVMENGLKRLKGDIAAIKKQITQSTQSNFAQTHLSIHTKAAD